MRPKNIILVRHGQSIGNVDKSHYALTPDYRLQLTDVGMDQAIQAGKVISDLVRNESVYAYYSPWIRTKQTFGCIHEQMPNKIVRALEDPRLREQDWGHYKEVEFLAKENANRKEYGKFYFRLQDGESGADVYDRISSFMETLHRDFQKPDYPENSLIVTHGVTLMIFCMRWFHWSVEEFEQYRNPHNGQVIVLGRDESRQYRITSKLGRTTSSTPSTSPV
ncbi:MAG: phosphoglycerate mutase family protein [Candidatus Sedimenticola sp. (ex Thyasira tokunagai)]